MAIGMKQRSLMYRGGYITHLVYIDIQGWLLDIKGGYSFVFRGG